MEKEFVTYELALRMKQIGFDEPCLKVANSFGYIIWKFIDTVDLEGVDIGDILKENFDNEWTNIPTWGQAFRWIREKHNFQSSIEATSCQHNFEKGYNYYIWNHVTKWEDNTMPKDRPHGDFEFYDYDEAQKECLNVIISVIEKEIK